MASSSSRRRPGKEPMVTEPPTYDTKRFRSQFHEGKYHRFMKKKHIIHERYFALREEEYPIMKQINRKRRWDLLCDPIPKISALMIREFYANAVKESEESPSYKSYVRGTEVNFSPASITRALKLRTITYEEPSYEARLQDKNDPDEILQGICLEGTDWERDSQGVPSRLKRINLILEAKGWYEIVRRSILPTGNTSAVTIRRALLLYCILHGGEINLAQLIAESIQEIAESTNKFTKLGHPSTILRLCTRAGVIFEDEDTEKVRRGAGITKKTMEGTAEDDDQEEGSQRRRRAEEGGEQAHGAIDMSQLQRVLKEISQQNVIAQEQYSRYQEKFLEHREQYLKDKEQNEAWQHRMEERLESWHQQSMDQQQEFQAKILEGQKEQSKELRESIDKLYLSQAKYGEYTHNLYQWKNVHHTIGETRQMQRIKHYEDTQAKLEYLTRCMPGLNSRIKPFEQCQDLRDQQKARTQHYTDRMYQRLEAVGLSSLIDPVWDRRCPSEEIQDYTKLWTRKKKRGESSNNQEQDN
ncbi:uncharacterized protein DS421_19g656300 [Arachis hypogaea]|uniref:Putative plant transposon protein domain-containing protein n=1 Tax=Arachis hypogaea TaxID=3818 RepID=A0A6B9V9B4_ARAHY|nr:uncharacterized protein DS421_19g656300 [Arachis hypogaea]